MSKSTTVTVPASAVRAFYNDPSKGAARTASLTDPKCVLPGARGRLSPEAIAGYNKGKPAGRRYVSGNTKAVNAAAEAEAARIRKAALDAGVSVGKRGPLSNKALAAAGVKVPKRKASVRKG